MFVLMVGILDVWLGVSFRGSAVLTAVSATPADRRVSDDRLPDAVAGAQHGGRAQPDGDHRLACVRLCRRGISRAGNAGLSARVGSDPAPAMVYPDPVRPGDARRCGPVHRAAVRVPVRDPPRSCVAGLAALPRAGTARTDRSGRGRAAAPACHARRRGRLRGGVAADAGDRAVFSLFMLAPVLYAFFYPQPYLGQIVRKISIAIVDQDHSELGRALIQALEAHEPRGAARFELPGGGGCDPRTPRLRHPGD